MKFMGSDYWKVLVEMELKRRTFVRHHRPNLIRKRDCHIYNRAGDPVSFPFTMKRAT